MNPLIDKLEIKNWRNIKYYNLKFEKGINIIIGPNGAGKTSILEAIFFCLTGETRIPEHLKNLRRVGTDENFLLKLSISSNKNDIQIIREYKKLLRSYLNQNNIRVAQSKQEVDNIISSLYEINLKLFSNLIYSSEGEIYKFQNINQRSDMIKFLENILGFTKLIEFAEVTKNVNKFLNREKEKIKIKKRQLKELQLDSNLSYSGVERELKFYKTEMQKIKDNLKENYKKQGELKSEIKQNKSILNSELYQFEEVKSLIIDLYDGRIQKLDDIQIYEKRIFKDSNKIEKDRTLKLDKIKLEEENLNKYKSDLAVLDNKLNTYNTILKTNKISLDCPICERPLTEDQVVVLKSTSKSKKKELLEVVNDIESKRATDLGKVELLKAKYNKYKNLIKNIEGLKNLKDQYIASVLKNEIKKLDNDRLNLDLQIRNLEDKEVTLNQKITNLNMKLVKISDSVKIRKIENYDNNLNAADIGYLFGSIIIYSIDEIIKTYKMSLLKPLIIEMANIWNDIFPDDSREISIDTDFSPFLKYGKNQIKYDLLSSGEKILLLVILKTLMIKYFSSIPYLILDEPIEHLDEENRSLIIEYLVKIIQDGLIEQLIITTYEESIVRKFLDYEKVNIISLQTLEKYPYTEENIIY